MNLLSLGAGVQSTALLLLSAEGRLPKLDAAIFADTGWEPAAVYEHLNAIDVQVAQPADIPIHRVSVGNIRNDALDPERRFATMPLFVKSPQGDKGMVRRQCTAEYKVRPIKETVRTLLGDRDPLHLLVALNDRTADGQDVSWIWDVDYEPLLDHIDVLTVTGDRAHDMALRFVYAGLPRERVRVVENPSRALDAALAGVPDDRPLYVLPTYTAMLSLRAELVRRGVAREFWRDA